MAHIRDSPEDCLYVAYKHYLIQPTKIERAAMKWCPVNRESWVQIREKLMVVARRASGCSVLLSSDTVPR